MKSLIPMRINITRMMSNPIIIKELRSRMRGSRAFITLTAVLILMSLISYGLYQMVILTSVWNYSPLSPQIGQTLFAALAFLEMGLVTFLTPAVTSGVISSEHEKQTYEMLMTTPLNPTKIIWGKLFSALSYIFLLVFAAIPIGSLVFIYGGVSPRDMLKALIVLICTAILLGTIGIFMSTWLKRNGRAVITSYLIVLGLMILPTIVYGVIGFIRQAEPPRWILVPSPINALFSAIAPSTSLGNSGISLFGSISMLFGGNIGSIISMESIPRPLYHYTIPLYGLITLIFYFLATRLIRPVQRWQFKVSELIFGLIIILGLLVFTLIAFYWSSDRYENVSIFASPTPFNLAEPRQMEFDDSFGNLPITIDEMESVYTSVIREIFTQDLLVDTSNLNISKIAYFDPANPDENQEENFTLPEEAQTDINQLLEDLPIEITWFDEITETQFDNDDTIRVHLGRPKPKKPDYVQVSVYLDYPDGLPDQNILFNVFSNNGIWKAEFQGSSSQITNPETSFEDAEPLTLSFDDMASIYSSAILQAYTIDNPNPDIEIMTLYLFQSTGLAVDSFNLPPEVQNGINKAINSISIYPIWIDNSLSELDEVFTKGQKGNEAVVIFGPITHHNENNNSVEVMIDLRFNNENSVLVTYILKKIDGIWQITELGGLG